MKNTALFRGIGIGLAAAAVIAAAAPKRRKRKTAAGKTIHAISQVADQLSDSLGL